MCCVHVFVNNCRKWSMHWRVYLHKELVIQLLEGFIWVLMMVFFLLYYNVRKMR